MDMRKENFCNNKGIALVSAFMVIAVLLVLVSAFFGAIFSQYGSVSRFKSQSQAFNLAEAGLDQAVTWLRAQGSPPIGNNTNPWGGVQNLGNIGTFSVAIVDLGSPGGVAGVRRYRVTSTGTVGSTVRVLINTVQTDNYARYIWFTNFERYGTSNVWFWSQDYLNGPTHTNGNFNIFGNPVFNGEVRSVEDYIRYYNNGYNINSSNLSNPPYDNPVFRDGAILGVEVITMPAQALSLRSASTSAGGLRLQGNSTVVLNSDGTMNVTNSRRGWSNRNMSLPTNGALFVTSGSLTLSGTLSGRLTVGASSNVIVPNSIVYAHNPRTDPSSTDTLGIIAESNVVISSSAPDNLEIDASIMALNTSFLLNNWSGVAPKGTLTVYGGIIQRNRGPVGTFNGSTGQKISGYSKNYSYDPRLLNSPPPFLPTTGDYVTLSWEE